MKHFVTALIAVAAPLVLATPGANAADAKRPNVLFIAVDDLRPELGCYGSDHIQSPHIDALAERSMLFTRAYCQQAVCNPSRASLLTGLRPDSTKVWDLVTHFRDTVPDVVTLPQHFRKRGYYAVAYGKIYHNPLPDADSWDEPNHWPQQARAWSETGRERLAVYREQMRRAGKPKAAIQRMRAPATDDEDVPDRARPDGEIADQALAAMRRLAQQDQPFFLAVGFINPHLPFNAPRRYWDLYDPAALPLADNPFLPRGAPAMAMNTMYELRDYMDFAETPSPDRDALTEAQQQRLKHGYYAAVSFIDAQVGRLLDQLDRLNLRDDTIVVLWGDHGWKLGEHRSWCKQTNYEIDTRAPLIIHVPGTERKNRTCAAIVEFVDIYPTLCELAQLPLPDHLQGKSLVPLLSNPDTPWPNTAFSQFPRRSRSGGTMGYAMRTDRYRYVEWLGRTSGTTVAVELYDHTTDPQENTNLAAAPEQQARIADLSAAMWQAIARPAAGDLAEPKAVRPILRFKNHRSEAVEIFWLAPSGRRVSQGRVAPGKVLAINTTLNHQFSIGGQGRQSKAVITATKPDETIAIANDEPADSRRTPPPNILVLMGDDWSWPHAGFLGDQVVRTPTFDRLARGGVVFEHAFVSSPSCTPSRLAVATGQWHWRLGEGANLGGSLAKDVPVYPDILEAAGVDVPSPMTGRSLLSLLQSTEHGQIDERRTYTLTGMERHVYAHPSRAIRTHDFLYIRNYAPDRWPTGESQQPAPRIDFTDGSWPTFPGAFAFNIDPSPTKQYLLDHRTEADTVRFCDLAFARRPAEELYDLTKDPHQLHNVAPNVEYAPQRQSLCQQLEHELRQTDDPRVAKNDAATPGDTARRPNVLFIAMDDLNDWVGCLGGHPQALTPNLDRLAASGVLFTNAHCPAPACNPSRTAIFTGLSPHRSGLYDNRQKMREVLPDAELMPKTFSRHGYHSAGSGKLLHYFIDAPSWDDYYPEAKSENPFPRTLYPAKRPVSLPRGGSWQYVETDWGPLDATDEAYGGDYLVARWISEQLAIPREKPFFLACGIYRPHEPWFVPKKYFEPFPLESIRLPPGYREHDLDDLPPEGKRRGPNRYFAHIQKHNQWKQGIQAYLASIHFADAMLGKVLDALQKSPHADNTIVVLWSDHGWHLGEKQHWQKFTAWRVCTRVPLIVRVPAGTPGLPDGTTPSVCAKPVNLLSLFPTLLELCGLPAEPQHDGPSLVPLLGDPGGEWQHASVTYLADPGSYGLSTERWRYIHYANGDEELYDVSHDPHEWTNLAGVAEHASKLTELRAKSPKSFAPR